MRRERERKGVFTRRALLIAGAELTAFGALAAKLYQVQVAEGAKYRTLAESNRISVRLIAPPRGRLLDRFGVPVAANNQNWRALLIAEQAENVGATLDAFARLVPLADHERARIERDVRRHRRFIPVTVREFLTWEEMARIEVNAPDLPGIVVDVGTTRRYPFGPALAHVVGYVAPPSEADMGEDPMLSLPGIRVGRAGMEKYHEPRLRGRAGAVQLEVNAVGRVIRELDHQEGTPGTDVRLTIDAALQQQVLGHLGDESASAVVLDARNGAVLAMATNPSFDPSLFNSGVSQAQWLQWTSNRRAPLINKAAAGLYAPGSTFKIVVAMAGLESKAISPGDRINCPGYLDLGDTRFHCWKRGGHGLLDLRNGIKNSCDVFFYEVARRTGIDRIAAMANRFGLGVPLEIELAGARSGLIPTREWRIAQGKAWNIGDTIVAGIGQGFLQVTPLSLAVMAARIATGRAVQPHLTLAVGGVEEPGNSADAWPSMGLSAHAMSMVREGMWAVVNEQNGTAPLAKLPLPDVQMAGKTGSSQVRRVSREQREHGFKSETLPWEFRPHALFVAFAPTDRPRYACAVVVEHGNAGAAAAAPVARDIMVDVLTRDPANRRQPPPDRVAQGSPA
jgi:penicillin-binding protein 2